MKKGFTLVELIIAVSLFTVIMVISMGSIVSIIENNRKARNIKNVLVELNNAVETMSREMRFSENFFCHWNYNPAPPHLPLGLTEDCPGPGNNDRLRFTTSDGYQMFYNFDTSPFFKSVKPPVGPAGPQIPIISQNASVKYSHSAFYVVGSEAGDGLQPRVILHFAFTIGSGKTQSDFVIQTTIAPRIRDD